MIFKPWLNHRTTKAQKANKDLRKSIAYSKSQRIGIIFNTDDHSKIDAADKLNTLLKMDGKTVKILAYERQNAVKHLPYDTFSAVNFGFWGGFIGKPLEDFVKVEFDFLICIDKQPNAMIKSILANSKAKCRVGRYDENNEPLFEMLVKNNETKNIEWVDSIYHYIKIIA